MANFRKMRDILTLYHSSEAINDEEFVLLYDVFSSKNLNPPYKDYQRFSFDDMDPDECKTEFRFCKNDIPLLADVLRIPGYLVCSQGTICGGIEGLCILLWRLAYPCRYSDLVQRFGRPVPELSMISNTVLNYIYDNHHQRVTDWNRTLLSPAKLEEYARAISDKGAALKNCFGFIDGTVRATCRPDENQREVYNGHKKVHGLKFHSVSLPNGMIANLYGPVGKLNMFVFASKFNAKIHHVQDLFLVKHSCVDKVFQITYQGNIDEELIKTN